MPGAGPRIRLMQALPGFAIAGLFIEWSQIRYSGRALLSANIAGCAWICGCGAWLLRCSFTHPAVQLLCACFFSAANSPSQLELYFEYGRNVSRDGRRICRVLWAARLDCSSQTHLTLVFCFGELVRYVSSTPFSGADWGLLWDPYPFICSWFLFSLCRYCFGVSVRRRGVIHCYFQPWRDIEGSRLTRVSIRSYAQLEKHGGLGHLGDCSGVFGAQVCNVIVW